jgi:cytochrome c1
VRRLALIVALGALAAGCGGEETISGDAETVQGTPPAAPQPAAGGGDAEAGKAVFAAKGCGGCHTFEPAGSSGTTGPNLAEVEAHAEDAGKPLDEYVEESLKDPNAYVVEGFQPIMPAFSGTEKELADLVAFVTSGS